MRRTGLGVLIMALWTGVVLAGDGWEARIEVAQGAQVITERAVRLTPGEPSIVEVATRGGSDSQRVEVALDTRAEKEYRLTVRYLQRAGRIWTLRAQTAFAWPVDEEPPRSVTLSVPGSGSSPALDVRLSLTSVDTSTTP